MKMFFKRLFILCITVISVFALCLSVTACDVTEPDEDTVKFALSYGRGAYAAVGDIPEAKKYEEGERVTLAPSTTFKFSGYTFDGWTDGETVYEGGAEFIMPDRDVKLKALWKLGDPDAGSIIATSVGFEDEYFVFTGTVKNVEKLFVYLNNTNVSASTDNYVQAEITGDTFTARLPLSKLIGFNQSNIPFNLRYKIDSLSAETVGVAQGSLNLSKTHKFDEYSFRLAVNSGAGCVAVYYAPAPDTTAVVTASAVDFEDEYFVFTGTVKNVNNLFVYLINTNVSASADNYVQAEITGETFTARLPLDILIVMDVASNIPFNLRYRTNDSKVNVNVEQGSLDITKTYAYGGKIFRMGINNGCVAVYYTAAPKNPNRANRIIRSRLTQCILRTASS